MPDPCNPSDARFTVDESRAVPTAAVRADGIAVGELQTLFDDAFPALHPALEAAGHPPAGAAFVLYRGFSGDRSLCDVEVGFPLAAPLASPIAAPLSDGRTLRIVASELPAGKVASALHVGPHDGLPAAWDAFTTELTAAGHAPGLPCWEVYLTMPEQGDPAEVRTGLNIRVD